MPRCSVALVAAASLLGASAVQAAFEVRDEGWEGYSEFWRLARQELGADRVVLTPSLDYSSLTSADAVVIVHPSVGVRFAPLAAFLSDGGRAAVIDDFGRGDEILRRFHIQRGPAPSAPTQRLRGRAAMPIALPDELQKRARHPILEGVRHVVTNHPSTITLDPGVELTPLLAIPHLDGSSLLAVTGVIGDAEACGLGMTSGPVTQPCGRLVAISDASVFINLMLRYTGNHHVARGLVRYLVSSDTWGGRGGKLFIVGGQFSQHGSYGDEPQWSQRVAQVVESGLQWLRSSPERELPTPVLIGLSALLGLFVIIWVAQEGAQPYRRVGPAFSRPTPLAIQGGFAGRYALLGESPHNQAMLLLELQRTLEASLRHRLSLRPRASREEICVTFAGVCGRARESLLRSVFRRLAVAEAAVLRSRPLALSDRALRRLMDEILEILDGMKQPPEGSS